MIRGAIFDFDGTLFDSMFIWKTAGDRYLRSLGKEPEKELQKKLKTMSLRQSAVYMQRAYDLSASVEKIMDGVNHTVEDFYFNTVQPKPDVIPFLNHMKAQGIKMCIATATDGAWISSCGIPTVDALSALSEEIHTLEEHVSISSIEQRTALCALAIDAICRRFKG